MSMMYVLMDGSGLHN